VRTTVASVPEGHTIHRLARRHAKLFGGQTLRASSPQGRFADGAALLDGHTLEATDAYGKHLFHRYDKDLYLHVHLGLYGKFSEGKLPAPEPKGALRLRLQGDETYLDLRGPITCEVITRGEKDEVAAKLGPDPLRPGADPGLAQAKLARSRTALGALLMNQTVLAGVGNVYRAEILFRHGVHPYLAGRDLDPVVWLDMWEDLVRLMRHGVRTGKIITTDPDDRERRSGPARRVDAHYVYRRTGEPCRRCDTPIAHAVMVTRNLFWCPRCQPEPRDAALGAGAEVATAAPGVPVMPDEDE
jgi:endonuclease-8